MLSLLEKIHVAKGDTQYMKTFSMRSFMAVPLSVWGVLLGVLSVSVTTPTCCCRGCCPCWAAASTHTALTIGHQRATLLPLADRSGCSTEH